MRTRGSNLRSKRHALQNVALNGEKSILNNYLYFSINISFNKRIRVFNLLQNSLKLRVPSIERNEFQEFNVCLITTFHLCKTLISIFPYISMFFIVELFAFPVAFSLNFLSFS